MILRLTASASPPWHARRDLLERFVADLIADEVSRLRPGGSPLPAPPWPADLPLHEAGLGLDSLERLSIASALNEALHLHESGLEDLLLTRECFGEWIELAAEALAVFDARLSFRSSGSQGQAKACTHTLSSLSQEVEHLASLTTGARRVLTAVPAHHIYGFLFTVLLPARLGCEAVLDIRRQTPQALAQGLQPADLVVSHPAHWAVLARHAAHLPGDVHGVTSTAPCPDDLAQDLLAKGLARLTQVYGSSETAGIGIRHAALAPFQLMPFWARNVHDAKGLLRTTAEGTQSAHPVQDLLEWTGDREFRVCGRLDEAVQVGGINVFPSQIRKVLIECPQVADAVVRLMSPDEGSRLKAFIVPGAGTDVDALRVALEAWSQAHLGAASRPRAYSFGERLPRTPMGKPADWPLNTQSVNA